MIEKLLICDSQGYPFYTKDFDSAIPSIDQALLSGLISTIGTLGRQLFKKEIANITFGTGVSQSHIFIVTKELISEGKSIYFVISIHSSYGLKILKNRYSGIGAC
jgi:hypothetical protein